MTTIGQNSPETPDAEHRRPERRREQPRVRQDRDERAECRRAERHAEQPAFGIQTGFVQDEAHDDADRERDWPSRVASAYERAARHTVLDELEAREEEQEHETQVGQEVDVAVDLRDVQPFRADEDAEQDLQHHGRQDDTAVQPRQDCAGARRREHEDERAGRPAAAPPPRAGGGRSPHDGIVGVIPHVLVNELPGSRWMSDSPLWKASGGHVIGSTARLRRSTSGSGSPVKSIR